MLVHLTISAALAQEAPILAQRYEQLDPQAAQASIEAGVERVVEELP